ASSANTAVFGQSVPFTATVTAPGGIPTGIITFLDGSTTLGSAQLLGGTATLTTSSLAVGSHALTAVYTGDGNFNGSSSPVLVETVSKRATSVALVTSALSVTAGQALTFSGRVRPQAPAAGAGPRTVRFSD